MSGSRCLFRIPGCMYNGYTESVKRKDVVFKIRIDEELRRTFVEAYHAKDRSAAQVMREFMCT